MLDRNSFLISALFYGLWPAMVLLSEVVQTFILADFCFYYVKRYNILVCSSLCDLMSCVKSKTFLQDWRWVECSHYISTFIPKPLIIKICFQLNKRCLYNGLAQILGWLLYPTYTHQWELMNSVGSHGSLSLLFMMKVMIWHFVGASHKVMTALIVLLL